MTVTVGIWLGHKSYFNYEDPAKVAEQLAMVKRVVGKHKDHPSLLMWGLGNEMEVDGNDGPALWTAIDDLAKATKAIDPNHPTMTVVAEVSDQKIANIKRYAPHVDVLGINTYGGAGSVAARLKKAGWTKPYVVTEFGPLGPWERPKTAWGAAKEQTSTEKAAAYARNYQSSIASQAGWNLGAYAFLWGDKQEETPTWFGMFLPSGERTGAVDVMQAVWSGRAPKSPCPKLFDLSGAEEWTTGEVVDLIARVEAPESAKIEWTIRAETKVKAYAGEGEKPGQIVNWPIRASRKGETITAAITAPTHPGVYRVFLKVADGDRAAVANLPIRVR